jgi:hypothetical protein
MSDFRSAVSNLPTIINEYKNKCANRKAPTPAELQALIPKIQNARSFFMTLGVKGNANVFQECALYGFFDKGNVPDTPSAWVQWMLSLESQVNAEIAVAVNNPNANVINQDIVNRNEVNVNALPNTPNAINSTIEDAKNTVAKARTWINTPLLTVMGLGITPKYMMIAGVLAGLVDDRRRRYIA